jgi:hypothetical protein
MSQEGRDAACWAMAQLHWAMLACPLIYRQGCHVKPQLQCPGMPVQPCEATFNIRAIGTAITTGRAGAVGHLLSCATGPNTGCSTPRFTETGRTILLRGTKQYRSCTWLPCTARCIPGRASVAAASSRCLTRHVDSTCQVLLLHVLCAMEGNTRTWHKYGSPPKAGTRLWWLHVDGDYMPLVIARRWWSPAHGGDMPMRGGRTPAWCITRVVSVMRRSAGMPWKTKGRGHHAGVAPAHAARLDACQKTYSVNCAIQKTSLLQIPKFCTQGNGICTRSPGAVPAQSLKPFAK